MKYYGSPGGGGDGSSSSKPFQIADYWSKAKPSDTLILLDGTYTGSRSMVDPPNGLNGTNGLPINIKALNDGKVMIDGQGSRIPIWLNNNDWFIIEGLNAGRSAHTKLSKIGVVFIENSNHNIIRRVCAWDAPNGNSKIYMVGYYSNYNLIEDCAGWGRARKVITTIVSSHNTFRRFFGIAQGNSDWTLFGGEASPYYGTGNIFENTILTVDMRSDANQNGISKLFGCPTETEPDMSTKAKHYIYGCIGYRKTGQRGYAKNMLHTLGSGTGTGSISNRGFKQYIAKDMVIYNELDNQGVSWYGLNAPSLKSGKFFYEDFQIKNVTMIGRKAASGGSHINFYTTSGDSRYHSIRNSIAVGANVGVQSSGGISDYIWAYNNGQNFKGDIPAHYRTDALDLTANGGNILQYGLSEAQRPKVNGQSVGAQIQYRYVNGILTNEPLWPWPMNQRIIDAMKQSGYEPIDVTKTVFALGRGMMPNVGVISGRITDKDTGLGISGVKITANGHGTTTE